MRLIKRVFIALGLISIISCSHHGGRSNGTGSLRGKGNSVKQPQDGSLIVTPEGTRELKIEPPAEEPVP